MTTTLQPEVALTVRRVNAYLAAQGRPEVPELAELWNRTERALAEAADEGEARRALARYEAAAVLAIRRVAT